MTYQDKQYVGQCLVNTFNGTRYKADSLKHNFKNYSRKALVQGQIDKLLRTLDYQKKRYKLFGCIPVVKELYAPGQEYNAILFDVIPLFRCVRGQYNDKFYVLGLQLLKISH